MDPAQLAQVEALCETLYNASNEVQRSQAQTQLLSLQSSAEYIPQCQYILDKSKNAYALLLAANSLTHLITNHWNNFTVQQRVDVRNYILGYLANNGPGLTDYVVKSLIQLLCRITKLGWFDDNQHRELVEEVTKFLAATIDHCIIGLRILNQLVEEINIPTSGRTIPQHRKTAVSFRDQSLLSILQISLTSLTQLHNGLIQGANRKQEEAMAEQALALCTNCLNFDFIGTNPDESSEDVGTIQVPSTWRDLVTASSTLKLLFDYYRSTDPPRSSLAMQSIVLLSSVRRSLFSKEQDRVNFLQQLMDFIREILQTQHGLQHQDNYHEFCRQLGRLKANYQLSELVRVDGYVEWVELAAAFTIKSFQNWQWSTNSIHYLLALWGRLVAAVPYVRSDAGSKDHTQRLQECVLQVTKAYIQSMVDSVDVVLAAEGAVDDPLDDEGSLKEQLDKLPVICRFQFQLVAQHMLTFFDPALQQYHEALRLVMGHNPPQMQRQLQLLEGKLTWLVYMVGAVVGGFSWSDASSNEGEETIDASLSRRVFQLAQGIDFRLTSQGIPADLGLQQAMQSLSVGGTHGAPAIQDNRSAGQGKCQPKLELALLYFFQTFRRMYMWEQHGLSPSAALSGLMMVVDFNDPAGGGLPKDSYAPSLKQKVFARFFEHMKMGEHPVVINIIIQKIGNNLKYWPNDEDVVGKTLGLFYDMACGYSSSKMLLGLDTIKFLIHHHTPEAFPFLIVPANTRHRTTFHLTIARLIFSTADEMTAMFDGFMEPILAVLVQLGTTANYRQESVKQALIGVCRDLRGITAATNNRRVYTMLFEALYPAHFGVFVRAAEEWAHSPEVTTALLKFMQEFVYNKAQRLVFDQSSPNGILLFRETSRIVVACGARLVQLPAAGDVYRSKYKGASLVLQVLTTALAGTYVNFGVFALYNDKALDNALETSLQLAMSVPSSDVMAFPKLCKAYFNFFEVLFRNHITVVLALGTGIFMQIMQALHEGLQSLDAPLASQCAATIDHLATYLFMYANKDTPPMRALKLHLAANPTLLPSLLTTLFNILLFDSTPNQTTSQWAVTRPILSVLMADEQAFNSYRDNLIASQTAENQVKLSEAFTKLLTDIQRNLESTNRDRFTQKLTGFRMTVRSFLVM